MPDVLLPNLLRAVMRNMVPGGISKHVAKRLSGHVTDSVFDRCDITEIGDLEDAARKIEGRANGQ